MLPGDFSVYAHGKTEYVVCVVRKERAVLPKSAVTSQPFFHLFLAFELMHSQLASGQGGTWREDQGPSRAHD